MQRFVLTLQYLGTRYAGWQRQTNAVAIQEIVENALESVCGIRVPASASGRTDAGVHAAALPVHADIPIAIDGRGLVLALNAHLPDDIRVVDAREAPPGFHARFDAKRKTYVYSIWNAPVADVFHAATHAHVAIPLDESRMAGAAAALVGHHDFRSFTVPDPEVASTWRTVERVTVDRDGNAIAIAITADGFLRYMVRRIAGILIEVGRGKLPPERVAEALEPTCGESRWTAPPNGLTLANVDYGERVAPALERP
jgi:tRNA pseudouridine38-40 synthase